MSGYKYRDPNRVGQPLFTETDKRMHELEQENAQLRQQRFQARRQVEGLAQELDYYKKRGRELGQERVQAVKQVAGRVGVNHARVLNLLTTLRGERQVLAGERSRRQHAEQALSRSEQRTDNARTKLDRERVTHRQAVVGLQETIAGLEETIGELRARLAQRHDVVTENRVAQLEGALADQQQITADRTRERDMARGEAIGAYSLLDEAHTLLTRGQLQVFEAKRLARVWGIPFEHPEGEVAS